MADTSTAGRVDVRPATGSGVEVRCEAGMSAEGARVIDYAPQSLNKALSDSYYFWMITPAIVVLAAISLYPFFWLIWMSLHSDGANGQGTAFVGMKNFVRLFTMDTKYWDGWYLLIKYSMWCMALEITLGVLLAIILNGSRLENVLVTVFLMPMMMAPAIAGLVWYFLYNSTFGWYHWLLQSLGILGDTSILGSTDTALYGLVIVDVWQWTPLITLITLAGMKRVPRDQLEANMVDGASELRNFISITLPHLYPFLLIAILLRFMDNFRFIDVILALTGGGPADATNVLPVYLFEVSFNYFKLGRAAAIALTLLLVTIVLGKTLVRVFEGPASQRADMGK